jgi:serine/threonine protein kinase
MMRLFHKLAALLILITATLTPTKECLGSEKRALKTKAKETYRNNPDLCLSKKDFVRAALFIDRKLPKYVNREKFYLRKSDTKLKNILEYDPETKRVFIVLDNKKSFLGKGRKKIVSKAILYDQREPKLVARLQQLVKVKKEIEISRIMQGSPGIYEIYGFGKKKKTGQTVYAKLYRPGSLSRCFKNKIRLKLSEKMHIALSLLRGLESLHSKGIVHRDLCTQNCLIDITPGKRGKRVITACIADLGRCDNIQNVSKSNCQGHSTYTPPEGLLVEYLNVGDYMVTDVFALGCIFYQLYYGKMAPWQKVSYKKQTTIAADVRYDKLAKKINKATLKRRSSLEKRQSLGKTTPKKAFECLILRMLHIDPAVRGTAAQLREELERIKRSAENASPFN